MSDAMPTHHGPGEIGGAPPGPPASKLNKKTVRNVVIGVGLGLALWTLMPRPEPIPGTELPEVPASLVGEWRSDDEPYHDRFFTLEPLRLTLGFGAEAPPASYVIESVHRFQEQDYTAYIFEYRDLEVRQLMEVHHLAGGDIRLKNPSDVIWRRVR